MGDRYFSDISKMLKGPGFDDSKMKNLMSGTKLEVLAICESLAGTDAAHEVDAAVKAQLLAQLGEYSRAALLGSYQQLAELQAIKHAAQDMVEARAVGADPAADLAARAAARKPAGAAAADYKHDRMDVDKAVKAIAASEDDDNIQASHAAAGSSALARIKCQVTRKLMTEPVRNVGCGHVYEKSGIETLRKPGKAWLCPIAGCKKPISELVADADTKYLIDQEAQRRIDEGLGEDDDEGGAGDDDDDDDDE